VAISANFWAVIFSPILNVRFNRRWYAASFAWLHPFSSSPQS